MNPDKSYIIEEWWTPSQVKLVRDVSRTWQKQRFTAAPGYWTMADGAKILSKIYKGDQLPEGAVLDNTAWDHEHCELCWTKISENQSDQPEGYTDKKEWLCVECYNKYIVPARPTD